MMDRSGRDHRHGQPFTVQMNGFTELLANNLYSQPGAYIRELLQNAYDAIVARRKLDPQAPGLIRFEVKGNQLRISDTGIGLSVDQATSLLPCLGATSKKDEFGFSDDDYLGEFGIGVLSYFTVSPVVTIYSRTEPGSHNIVKWSGSTQGTWSAELIGAKQAPELGDDVGTIVVLEQRPGEKHFTQETLIELLTRYAQYLPVKVTLTVGHSTIEISSREPVWCAEPSDDMAAWCKEAFGFMPMIVIPLADPVTQIQGFVFVASEDMHLGSDVRHQIYLRNILVSDSISNLVPPWAYFVRVVVNFHHLNLALSKDGVRPDEAYMEACALIEDRIRTCLFSVKKEDGDAFVGLIRAHGTGLKALAVSDRESCRIVAQVMPYPTTLGVFTLDEVLTQFGEIRYVCSLPTFQAVKDVASANGLCVVNAGYAYDEDVMKHMAAENPACRIEQFTPSDLSGVCHQLSVSDESEFLDFIYAANRILAEHKVSVVVRSFSPVTIPALYLQGEDPDAHDVAQNAAQTLGSGYSDLIESMNPGGWGLGSKLVVNANCALINQLALAAPSELVDHAVRVLYVNALMAAGEPLDPSVASWPSAALSSLIDMVNTMPKDEHGC